MLDLEPIDFYVNPEFLYVSNNKSRFWIKGNVSDKPHVTLLYGLLQLAEQYKPLAEEVLKDWDLQNVEISNVDYFESPYEDEPYYCMVGKVAQTPKLLEGHQRLSFLPHINTFSEYTPHVTLAYIKKIPGIRDSIINTYSFRNPIKVKGINYGK